MYKIEEKNCFYECMYFHIIFKMAFFVIIISPSRIIKSVLYFKCIIILQNDYDTIPYKLDPKIPSKFELLKLDTMTSVITTELKTPLTSSRHALIFVSNKISHSIVSI